MNVIGDQNRIVARVYPERDLASLNEATLRRRLDAWSRLKARVRGWRADRAHRQIHRLLKRLHAVGVS